jgi:hypothetical protein
MDARMSDKTVKEAVRIAVDEVTVLFDSQQISGVLLEEVDRSPEGDFLITVGFDRPSLSRGNPASLGSALSSLRAKDRVYKVVRLKPSGDIVSIKDRMLERK